MGFSKHAIAAEPAASESNAESLSMQLIAGNRRLTLLGAYRVADGLEVDMAGEPLRQLLDVVFLGLGTIEAYGGPFDRHRLEVSAIAMQGASTRLRLRPATGTEPRLN